MSVSAEASFREFLLSDVAENLAGSEIIKLAWEVNDRIKKGEKVFNLTIGDFNPEIFPIPEELKKEIISAYEKDQTNYPPAEGVPELRNAVSHFLLRMQGLFFPPENIIIACGARPLIYSIYKTILDPGDAVIFPVPSWNNNHYCHLSSARQIVIETLPENNFMPSASQIKKHIRDASLVSLCSPLNPSGTVFSKKSLEEICDVLLEENASRKNSDKPVYLLYDQIYWMLSSPETGHYEPVSLRPEMRNYTVYVDGISKAFASTGVRVGWGAGSKKIIDKMKSMLGHIGAWAPRPEQMAAAAFLKNVSAIDAYLSGIRKKINSRLNAFYDGFSKLRAEGFCVNAIAPQSAIYLAVQFSLKGMKTADGKILDNTQAVTRYLLNEAKVALVPFYAFGASEESDWYRLSVGTCGMEDIDSIFANLKNALSKLS